ncbi:MAG: hypothetical protein LBK82_16120 [Planctomycetaceae bacterium]|nr:hypothetical protein [Planctomycetaceae bacterium]
MSPKRKATQLAIVNLIHCRRVRRDLLAKGRLPDDYQFDDSDGKHLIR